MATNWNNFLRGAMAGGGGRSPQRPSSPVPGGIGKGFGSIPNLQNLRRVVSTPPSISGPHGGSGVPNPSQAARVRAALAARSRPQHPSREQPQVSPLVYVLYLGRPGSPALGELLRESAGFLDSESGDTVHWLALGDPNRSGDEYRRFLAWAKIDLAQLNVEWAARVADRGDERGVVAQETALIASTFGVKESDLPVLLVFTAGSESKPLTVKLPQHLTSTMYGAREVLQVLREELAPDVLRRTLVALGDVTTEKLEALVRERAVRLHGALNKLSQSERQQGTTRSMASKKALVTQLVAEGRSLEAACKEVGISRGAVYKDKARMRLIGIARDGHKRRPGTLSTGSKFDGDVEAEAPADE